MSALTNLPMRALSERLGCGLTITEFLPAPALAAGNRKVLNKLRPSPGGRPFGVQIYGRHPRQMEQAAAVAAAGGAALVDINMGCPAKKVTRGICGSALMREPDLACEIVRAVKRGVAGRAEVTVKMRAGWDDREKNAPVFATRVVEAGACAIAVHGRTRAQRFEGLVDYDIIAQVKQAVDVPVIANGDISDIPSASRALQVTGSDGIMVGRAALGNPWVFATLRAWFEGAALPAPPSPAQRVQMYLDHLELYLQVAEPHTAALEMRKFAAFYLQSVPRGTELRQQINRLTDVVAIRHLLHDYTDRTSVARRKSRTR